MGMSELDTATARRLGEEGFHIVTMVNLHRGTYEDIHKKRRLLEINRVPFEMSYDMISELETPKNVRSTLEKIGTLLTAGKKVLVSCWGGRHTSPGYAGAMLVLRERMSPTAAAKAVRHASATQSYTSDMAKRIETLIAKITEK